MYVLSEDQMDDMIKIKEALGNVHCNCCHVKNHGAIKKSFKRELANVFEIDFGNGGESVYLCQKCMDELSNKLLGVSM